MGVLKKLLRSCIVGGVVLGIFWIGGLDLTKRCVDLGCVYAVTVVLAFIAYVFPEFKDPA